MNSTDTTPAAPDAGAAPSDDTTQAALRLAVAATFADAQHDTHASVPVADLREVLDEVEDLTRLFDLMHEADMRGVTLWRAQNPEALALISPDRGEMVAWLLAERDALAADRERLDWYEEHADVVHYVPGYLTGGAPQWSWTLRCDIDGNVCEDGHYHTPRMGQVGTLRVAIDAARAAATPGGTHG